MIFVLSLLFYIWNRSQIIQNRFISHCGYSNPGLGIEQQRDTFSQQLWIFMLINSARQLHWSLGWRIKISDFKIKAKSQALYQNIITHHFALEKSGVTEPPCFCSRMSYLGPNRSCLSSPLAMPESFPSLVTVIWNEPLIPAVLRALLISPSPTTRLSQQ